MAISLLLQEESCLNHILCSHIHTNFCFPRDDSYGICLRWDVVRRKVWGRPYQFKRNTRRSGRKHITLNSKYNGASCVHVASEKVEERPLGGCINVQKAQLCKRKQGRRPGGRKRWYCQLPLLSLLRGHLFTPDTTQPFQLPLRLHHLHPSSSVPIWAKRWILKIKVLLGCLWRNVDTSSFALTIHHREQRNR